MASSTPDVILVHRCSFSSHCHCRTFEVSKDLPAGRSAHAETDGEPTAKLLHQQLGIDAVQTLLDQCDHVMLVNRLLSAHMT